MEQADNYEFHRERMEKEAEQDEKTRFDNRNITLNQIIKWAEDISGSWNGDESGRGEDRAGQANEILEKIEELEELISGMDEL